MVEFRDGPPSDRARVGWWLVVLALAAAVAFVGHHFVGLLALGVFGYYATRPIYREVRQFVPSDGVAAWATLLAVLVPIGVLLVYVGLQAYKLGRRLLDGDAPILANSVGVLSPAQRETLRSALRNPRQFVTDPGGTIQQLLEIGMQAAGALVGGLLLIALAVTLSYFLLKNDDAMAGGFRELVGGRDATAYAYAAAVDRDLESVFFGNFLFVVVMSFVAAVAYAATNALAPQGLSVPMVFVLAVLTGAASLVPIVVGKIVYLPVVGYLALQAIRAPGNQLVFVAGALVAYFLLLDILPQTFLQPYITGQQIDMVLMMFAYLLGPVLFGWYGFFLLPILLIFSVEALRIVVPELVRGEPLTPTVSIGDSIGADLDEERYASLSGGRADAQGAGEAAADAASGDGANGGSATRDGVNSGGASGDSERPDDR